MATKQKIKLSDDWHTDEPLAYATKCHDDTLAEYRVFTREGEAREFASRQLELVKPNDGSDHMIGMIYPLYAGVGRCLRERRFG